MTCILVDESGVYKITNLINDKIYVGSANNLRARWHRHRSELSKNKHHNKHLQSSWNKYGEDCFEFRVIEIVDNISILQNREQYWLDTLKSYDRQNGYNILKKAYTSSGYKHSEEALEKMSIRSRRWHSLHENPMKGVKMSDESKLKMSIIRKKIFLGEGNPFYGRNHSESTKEKISATKRASDIRGVNHPRCKLKESDVILVKLLIRDYDFKPKKISEITNVERHFIGDIKRGKTWSHVDISHIPHYDDYEKGKQLL